MTSKADDRVAYDPPGDGNCQFPALNVLRLDAWKSIDLAQY